MTRLLQYRFPVDSTGAAGPGGHAFGNLPIAALPTSRATFEEGVRLSNRVLAVRGQVVPVAPGAAHASRGAGRRHHVGRPVTEHHALAGIRRVCISPAKVEASSDAVEQCIRSAELIVLGPGSLYTSLPRSLLVPALLRAEATSGLCVRPQRRDTTWRDRGLPLLSEHMAVACARSRVAVGRSWPMTNPRARQPADYPAAPVRLT